jgi:hypothetical protein
LRSGTACSTFSMASPRWWVWRYGWHGNIESGAFERKSRPPSGPSIR